MSPPDLHLAGTAIIGEQCLVQTFIAQTFYLSLIHIVQVLVADYNQLGIYPEFIGTINLTDLAS